MALVEVTDKGLYCPQADIYIDPWRSVPRALTTHAHSDHARFGSNLYIAHEHCTPLLKARLGSSINTKAMHYGEEMTANNVRISLHPAGHIPGSAQVRLEYKGEICVVSGDYKLENDGLSVPFEPVKCHTFISESTFGLPVFNWRPQAEIFDEINAWWKANKEEGVTSIISAYSLGKAQRILLNVDHSIGKVYTHTAVENMNAVVRTFSPQLPSSIKWNEKIPSSEMAGNLIIVPPSAVNTPWIERFRPYSLAAASGWMQVRGTRKWSAADKGFVLSDHADWKSLNIAIKETGAEKVYITHGYTAAFSRWLNENGTLSFELETLFEGETQNNTEEASQ